MFNFLTFSLHSRCLLLVRRHAKQNRQKKKRSQETDVIQPVDATHSNSQEQIPEHNYNHRSQRVMFQY
jgi:hypothetical protein